MLGITPCNTAAGNHRQHRCSHDTATDAFLPISSLPVEVWLTAHHPSSWAVRNVYKHLQAFVCVCVCIGWEPQVRRAHTNTHREGLQWHNIRDASQNNTATIFRRTKNLSFGNLPFHFLLYFCLTFSPLIHQFWMHTIQIHTLYIQCVCHLSINQRAAQRHLDVFFPPTRCF